MPNCSDFYCSPNACDIYETFDALKEPTVEEDVDSAGAPPTSPSIQVGTVTYKVEAKVNGLTCTVQSVNVSPSISLTEPIPGAVISKANEYIQEHGEGWLNGASTDNGLAQVISECSDSDWQDLIEAAIGLKDKGAYLPKGNKYNKPVWTKTTTVTYYTDGHFEGCPLGTSDAYGADGYPCGYGSFDIKGNLLWPRPNNPTPFVAQSIEPIFNPCIVWC
jgi:hypothetical protein